MKKAEIFNSSHADEKLRNLAMQRSQAIQGAMIQAGIAAEKIYLLAPQKSAADTAKPHVQLSLKADN